MEYDLSLVEKITDVCDACKDQYHPRLYVCRRCHARMLLDSMMDYRYWNNSRQCKND